jgi:hypothetical protein
MLLNHMGLQALLLICCYVHVLCLLAVCQVLDLSNNQLTSSLPGSWARMSFLSVLSLQNNNLTGTLPVEWAEQRALLNL